MPHIDNRDSVLRALREELVGPCPLGEEIDCTQMVHLEDAETAYRAYRQRGSGEEILQRDSPTKRYGVGVLYPIEVHDAVQELGAQLPPAENDIESPLAEIPREALAPSAIQDCEQIAARAEYRLSDGDSDDFDLSSANTYKPSCMAVSILMHLPQGAVIEVEASGGRYALLPVMLLGRERDWWLRSPVNLSSHFHRDDLPVSDAYASPRDQQTHNVENLDVRIELFSRPYGTNADEFLVTACLVNRQQAEGRLDSLSLFQSGMEVRLRSGCPGAILPYPESEPLDSEERSQELLYRDKLTFAVGHGCAADWIRDGANSAECVSANCLPSFETPNITPDIRSANGNNLVASMRSLSGIDPNSDGIGELDAIVREYETWISEQRSRIVALSPRLQATAETHMEHCAEAALRMRDGMSLLASDPQVRRAFRLNNSTTS